MQERRQDRLRMLNTGYRRMLNARITIGPETKIEKAELGRKY